MQKKGEKEKEKNEKEGERKDKNEVSYREHIVNKVIR